MEKQEFKELKESAKSNRANIAAEKCWRTGIKSCGTILHAWELSSEQEHTSHL